MRVWKIAGGSVWVLGVLALTVAASAPLAGQQRFLFGEPGGTRIGVTVRDVATDEVA